MTRKIRDYDSSLPRRATTLQSTTKASLLSKTGTLKHQIGTMA
jgi:hypothetical protein